MSSRRSPLHDSLAQLARDFGEALLGAVRGASPADLEEFQVPGSDRGSGSPSAGTPLLGKLTAREQDVFYAVLRGATNAGVASILGISLKTVQTHRAKVNRKLGVRSGAELVRFGAMHGLLNRGAGDAVAPSGVDGAHLLNLAEVEGRTIAAALRAAGGNHDRAAKLLGIPPSTLSKKLASTPSRIPSARPRASHRRPG